MQRIIGKKKKDKCEPTLDDVVAVVESKADVIDSKIAVLHNELLKCKDQLRKMRDGPAKESVRQKAMRVLQQKKVYERQAESLKQHAFNAAQSSFAVESVKATQATLGAMKSGMKTLKKELRKVNVDDIDDLLDDVAELREIAEDVQGAIGRSYDMPPIDDDDLEAELEALAEDIALDEDTSYLDEALAATPTKTSVLESKVNEVETDEFGLPAIPNDPLGS